MGGKARGRREDGCERSKDGERERKWLLLVVLRDKGLKQNKKK